MIWAPYGSLRLWGGGRWVGGHLEAWGVSLDMCTCTCTHAHAENAKINMLGNCKWPPPWRQPCLSCLTCMHVCAHVRARVCVHVCVHTCVGSAPTQPHPHPPNHPPPRGGTPQVSKNAIRLERIKIFRFCLKIWNLWTLPHPWAGVFLVGGWVDGWVSGSKDVKS